MVSVFENLAAQDIIKSKFQASQKTYNCYEMQTPAEVKGLLILLPAAGEKPKSIFGKTALPQQMAVKGYVTVIPEIPAQMFAYEECLTELNELIKIKTTEYKLGPASVVIGGLSDGGATALCYAEYLNSRDAPIKLKAVFAVDPPADLTRIYASGEKELSFNCPMIVREARNGLAYLNNTFGGPPAAKPEAYTRAAAYSANAEDGGNARFLNDIPVRLYSEPDLAFVQKEYCAELQFSNINAYDLEKMIVCLKNLGNERSAYITTNGKGFHSWNIVDAEDCAAWISGL
jgi:hypothetical protein